MAMLVPPRAHTPAGLRRKAGIRYVGFKTLRFLHRSKLIKPGSSEHDPDFFYRESKADNGTTGTD
jgi:hypothetical protein